MHSCVLENGFSIDKGLNKLKWGTMTESLLYHTSKYTSNEEHLVTWQNIIFPVVEMFHDRAYQIFAK